MGERVDFSVMAGKKKQEERCLYCGDPPHKTPLACPRISVIYVSDEATVEGIEFHAGWAPQEEDDGPADGPRAS